jgi:hypothetical protein
MYIIYSNNDHERSSVNVISKYIEDKGDKWRMRIPSIITHFEKVKFNIHGWKAKGWECFMLILDF